MRRRREGLGGARGGARGRPGLASSPPKGRGGVAERRGVVGEAPRPQSAEDGVEVTRVPEVRGRRSSAAGAPSDARRPRLSAPPTPRRAAPAAAAAGGSTSSAGRTRAEPRGGTRGRGRGTRGPGGAPAVFRGGGSSREDPFRGVGTLAEAGPPILKGRCPPSARPRRRIGEWTAARRRRRRPRLRLRARRRRGGASKAPRRFRLRRRLRRPPRRLLRRRRPRGRRTCAARRGGSIARRAGGRTRGRRWACARFALPVESTETHAAGARGRARRLGRVRGAAGEPPEASERRRVVVRARGEGRADGGRGGAGVRGFPALVVGAE